MENVQHKVNSHGGPSPLNIVGEERNQTLRESVTEDQLGTDDQNLEMIKLAPVTGYPKRTYLGCKTLEERADALVLDEILDDRNTANLLLKVRVLDTGLNRIQRRSDCDGSYCARDGRDEVLRPGCLVIICHAKEIVLGHSRCTEQLKARNQQRRYANVDFHRVLQNFLARFAPLSIPSRGKGSYPPRGISARNPDHGTPRDSLAA